MDFASFIVGLLLGLALAAWVVVQARSAQGDVLREHAEANRVAAEREARVPEQLARAQAALSTDAQMLDAFKSVSQEALAVQSAQLVHLAEAKYGALHHTTDSVLAGHGKAVDDGLRQLAETLGRLERERADSTTALRTLVGELTSANQATQAETAKLAAALRDNRVRGMWGEVQLRRVLELAGLDRHVDFIEQRGVSDGLHQGRPDVVVPLPNDRVVVIDSKVPLDRFLEAAAAANIDDFEGEKVALAQHAKAVAGHVHALAQRGYASMVAGSVDMVLLFLPGDAFLSAALDADPTLFESAAAKNVHLVTPTSLVPVLRGIALGWREYRADRAAAEIQQLGTELHERIAVFAEHYSVVGAQLNRTVAAYNKSVGSVDSRVVATARRLAEHGVASSRSVADVVEIDIACRPIRLLETGTGGTVTHQ